MVVYKIFIVSMLSLSYAARQQEISNDVEVNSKAEKAYPIITGCLQANLETADPLSVNFVRANLPTVNFLYRNGTLTGLSDSIIKGVNMNKEKKILKFTLLCPVLKFTTDYLLLGYINDIYVEGDGVFNLVTENYLITVNGYYRSLTNDEDSERIRIEKYLLEPEPKGRVKFNYSNLYNGDTAKGKALNKYLNKNFIEIDKLTRAPVLYTAIDSLIANLNPCLDRGLPPSKSVS